MATMASALQNLIFPPPPSLLITAMTIVNFASLSVSGLSEVRGKHMQYSKFWNVTSQTSPTKQIKLSSKTGMLIFYTPAFIAGVASFLLFPNENFRFLLLKSALTLHFFKRIFEVLFIHKFSGGMILESTITVCLSYLISTATLIYVQFQTLGLPEPSIDLKYVGVVLFIMGISGNFYHHYLLSKLRGEGEKEYKIPRGGFFNLVICPHYLFEIIGFVGFFFISQTLYALSFALGTFFYLTGRSIATRKWYLSKFEDFPKEVKALIPYVY